MILHKLGMSVLALAGSALAAGRPAIDVQGNYVEARTAEVYTGACFANSEVQLTGQLAVFGWMVKQGSWEGVRLDGLGVAAAVRASSTLGDRFGEAYPVKAVLMVDEKATAVQRLALQALARRLSGDLLQDVVRTVALPVEFTVAGEDIHSRRVTFTAGSLARIETRAMEAQDHTCGHEVAWYDPLAKTDHAMAAYALDHRFRGEGLNVTWWNPYKRSAFVGTFHLSE